MADRLFGSEDFQENSERPRGEWGFPVLMVLGFVIYEMTGRPVFGVAVLCFKFGWEDFRTAFWLRRVDPEVGRGRACFWLFLAFGLLKTAITGSFLMLAFGVITPLIPNQGNAIGNVPPVEFAIAAVMVMGGVVLSTVATCIALFKARRGRVKLWVGSVVHEARRQRTWPPPNPPHANGNQARVLILTALVIVCTTVILTLVPLLVFIGKANHVVSMACLVLVLMIMSACVLGSRDYFSRTLANNPSDCWGMSCFSELSVSDQT